MPRKTRPPAAGPAQRWHASMRPRPDAAENPGPVVRAMRDPNSFNEAAARCRGKPRYAAGVAEAVASGLQ